MGRRIRVRSCYHCLHLSTGLAMLLVASMGMTTSVQPPPMTTYKVTTYTGNVLFAGTDARVTVKLFGTSGESDPTDLPTEEGDMEMGNVNSYDINAPDIADLTALRIGHDNSG